MFDPDTMRARFRELAAKRATIKAKADPLRAKRDALVAAHDAVVLPLQAEIKAAEVGLFEIEQERALISRALNGKTGAV